LAGLKKALYCALHKKDDMINIEVIRCTHKDCKTAATFGVSYETAPTHCKKHMNENMFDIRHRKCGHEHCSVRPKFNIHGEKQGLFCANHRLENMIDVENKKCAYESCETIPRYNVAEIKSALYCSKHRLENMIDVVSPYCSFAGCTISSPQFNYATEKKGLFCKTHMLLNMIDVKHTKCIHENCLSRASYNLEGEKKLLYCCDHRKPDMVDITRKKCATHLCDSRLKDKKYEEYCFRCFVNIYPERPIARNYKTKEKYVVDRIREKFSDFDWISDRKISGGCSKRRPDLFLDLGFQVIIIEIDEYAHDTYDDICENKRIMEISQDIGHSPIMLIRFNPDSYTDSTGEKIQSCWAINKSGLMTVRKNHERKWNNRIDTLINQIQFCVDNPTEKTIDKIELFY
jgi:hypothetical protein